MGSLLKMIESAEPIGQISSYLDSLGHEERLSEMRTLNGKAQAKLYQMARTDLNISDFIPRDLSPHEQIIFYGHNSLPMFNSFQKRMCRSEDGSEVMGYNYTSPSWLSKITGPGYFVIAGKQDDGSEVLIDYTKKPQEAQASWPEYKPNEKGVSKFIYGNLKDYMRRVSTHMAIGKATKDDKIIGYFLLCRE